jgi:hypothetical protein
VVCELHSTSLQLIVDEGEAEGVGVELPTMRWLLQQTTASGFASLVIGKGNQCVTVMSHGSQLLREEGWDEPLTSVDKSTMSSIAALFTPKSGKLKIWRTHGLMDGKLSTISFLKLVHILFVRWPKRRSDEASW